MTPTRILEDARELISSPGKWAQGTPGMFNSDGTPSDRFDVAACRCLWIAILTAAHGDLLDSQAALNALGFQSNKEAFDWNDDPRRQHWEIIARFDLAITKMWFQN